MASTVPPKLLLIKKDPLEHGDGEMKPIAAALIRAGSHFRTRVIAQPPPVRALLPDHRAIASILSSLWRGPVGS